MASKRARRWYIALISVLGLYLAYRCALHFMVKAKLDEIRRQGYPVTLAELDKWYPEVPPGENAADVYVKAFAHCDLFWGTNSIDQRVSAITNQWPYWQEGTVWMQQQLLPVVGKVRLPPGSPPLPQGMKVLVAVYISDQREALELLHQAADKLKCRYPIDMTKIYEEDELGAEERKYFPHWSSLNFCSRLLQLETVMHADGGDAESTVNSLVALLALGRSLQTEPRIVAHWVRCNIEIRAVSSLEYALGRLKFSAPQVERLQIQFGDAEAARLMIYPVGGELCEENVALASDPWLLVAVGGLSHMNRFHRSALPIGLAVYYKVYGAAGLFDLDRLRFLEYMNEKLQTIRRLSDLPDSNLSARDAPQFPFFCRVAVGYIERPMSRERETRARLRTARIALAVAAFELRHGNLVAKVTDLEPEFLGQILADPFDGQPLQYKKLAKGYVVYSVGEDGKDDGGDEKKDITFAVER